MSAAADRARVERVRELAVELEADFWACRIDAPVHIRLRDALGDPVTTEEP